MVEITANPARAGGTICPQIVAIVTCSDRKKAPIPGTLRARELPYRQTRARAGAWSRRLQAYPVAGIRADQLYAGDHWHVASSLAGEAAGDLEIWVASAGYGLIRADQSIKPYSATFSTGPDSVILESEPVRRSAALREWWAALAESDLVSGDRPRSVVDLAIANPGATLIVAASKSYLVALRDDLVATRATLNNSPGRLVIVSAGTKTCAGLEEELLPIGAETQRELGGSRMSLNVRIVRHLIRTRAEHRWNRGAAIEVFRRSDEVPSRAARTPQTDEQVLGFIRQGRGSEPAITKTTLLRRLRDSGLACEQRRFDQLFSRGSAND